MNEYGDVEFIERGAFDGADMTNVVAVFNHDPNQLLGRFDASRATGNTLALEIDEVGLRFDLALPRSRSDVYEAVERGDLQGCSFKFVIGEERWDRPDDGPWKRRIDKIASVLDVGPVTTPAYKDTTVEARARHEAVERKTAEPASESPVDLLRNQLLITQLL